MLMNQQDTSTSTFVLSYEGDALSNNSIRARDLAPAMLAMDALLVRSNRLLNSETVLASLSVRAHRPGSFEIEFVLQVAPLAIGMLGSEYITSAANLVRLIFGSQHPGLFAIGKFLRGSPPASTETSGDSLIMEAEYTEGEQSERRRLIVPVNAHRLFQDRDIRQDMLDVLYPLQQDGIQEMLVSESGEPLERVNEDDLPSFIMPSKDSVLGESVTRQFLEIDTSRHRSSSRQWRFFDGNKTNNYIMRDEQFRQALLRREIPIWTGDIYECEVKSTQRIGPRGNIKTDLEILRVIGRRSPADGGTQTRFDL